jgi:hypothetical protein
MLKKELMISFVKGYYNVFQGNIWTMEIYVSDIAGLWGDVTEDGA